MSLLPVQFRYYTGLQSDLFQNARLEGSWDANGLYSAQWSSTQMQAITGEDGCPCFEATVQFDESQTGVQFSWGVRVNGPLGSDQWGIMTEVNDTDSMDRRLTFSLRPLGAAGGQVQQERYYLVHCRYLGANKFYRGGDSQAAIRFAVWAPNARRVDVVIGKTWLQGDVPRNPATQSLPRDKICGGYISEDGQGAWHDNGEWGPFPMTKQSDDVWVTDVDDTRLRDFNKFDHKPYMFQVVRDDGSVVYRTDIYSRCQIGFGKQRPSASSGFEGRTLDLDGGVSCSVVIDPDKVTEFFEEPNWPESNWLLTQEFWEDPNNPEINPNRPIPRSVEDLVIYELHVGALGFGKPEGEPGTLKDALGFLDYLEELGVNAVELLPLSEFGGGAGGWGYATSHYFAVEYSGGGRDNYKWFVRECHRRGIAVIMDVVYNHYCHNADRAEWMYDSSDHTKNMYYWYEGQPTDYPEFQNNVEASRRNNGGYVDNESTAWAPRYHEEMVRKMFVSSAVALAIEFHIDGFRVDQTTSIHNYNKLHADHRRSLRDANLFGQKLLRELTRALRFVRPDIMLMAEDHSNWNMVTEPSDQWGLGFDATWYSDFYHHVVGDTDKGADYAKLIKIAGFGDNRPLAMDYFAGALSSSGHKRIVYSESHDEAGNGRFTQRTIVTAVNGSDLGGSAETRRFAEARCRFTYGMTALSAGTPMFLFGEEVGSTKDFIYGRVLANREDLRALKEDSGKQLFRFYADMTRFRVRHSGIRSRNIEIVHVHNANRVLAFRRWDDTEEFLVCGNLSNTPFDRGYIIRHPHVGAGTWDIVFKSDSIDYGGRNFPVGDTRISTAGWIDVVLPACGFLVLQKR